MPLAAAAYSAAAPSCILWAAGVLAALMVAGIGVRLAEGESLASVVGTTTLADAALLGAVLLLGEAVRNRRAWAEEVRRRLRRAEAHKERQADRRVQEEPFRIARELHDVMAQTIAAINVQAGVAADVIDDAGRGASVAAGDSRAEPRGDSRAEGHGRRAAPR